MRLTNLDIKREYLFKKVIYMYCHLVALKTKRESYKLS